MRRTALFAALFVALLLAPSPATLRAETGSPPRPATQSHRESARSASPASTNARWNSRESVPATPPRRLSETVSPAPAEAASARKLVRSSNGTSNGTPRDATTLRSTSGAWTTSAGALALVLLVILTLAAMWKKYGPKSVAGLPADVIEVLGKRPLDQRHAIHLIRCGSRILIVGSSVDGLRTLAEVTDPAEVDSLAGLCRRHHSGGSTIPDFRQLLNRQPESGRPARRSASPRQPHLAERARYGETADLEEVHG